MEGIARRKRQREEREYDGVSVRKIIKLLAFSSPTERQKTYEELRRDFPAAKNKELRRDQFSKIIKEEEGRIRVKNTMDLTSDTPVLPRKKQRKMTDFLNRHPLLDE
jgi:hypothetical protein